MVKTRSQTLKISDQNRRIFGTSEPLTEEEKSRNVLPDAEAKIMTEVAMRRVHDNMKPKPKPMCICM